MMSSFIKTVYEGCKQAKKNSKSYMFLSVTIVLTFSIIGFYMAYNDSNIYNMYKNIMKESSNVAFVQYDNGDENKIDLFCDKLDSMTDTHYYLTSEVTGITLFDNKIDGVNIKLILRVIPNNAWAYYWASGYRAELVNGETNFHINKNEIIVCESLYRLIESSNKSEDGLYLNLTHDKKMKVVDACKDWDEYDRIEQENGEETYFFYALVSQDSVEDMEKINGQIVVYSQEIEQVERYAKDLELPFSSYSYEKQEMNKKITESIEIKKIILVILMIILGINMLSSFMNALSERKYEISIRRALGAGKGSVVLQFLIEGIVVIAIDILVSVAIIMDMLAVVKIYYYLVKKEEWIINITHYSSSIFFICCIFLALFFSAIFAVLSTRVEIIKYIKGE